MPGQKGKDLVVRIDDGGSFVTVAGLMARRLAFNAEVIDATHAQSSGEWRELIAGGGIKRAAIVASGLFKDQPSDALIRQAFFDGAVKSCEIAIPDFGTLAGPFQIVGLEFAGEPAGEVTFNLALESAGALTFTAA